MLRLSYCTTFISYSMFHSESNFSQYAISIGSQSIASFNVSIFHLPINVYSVFVESGSAVLNYCCFDKNETEEIDGNNVVCVNCSFGQKCENTFSIWWLEPEEDRSKRVITEFVYLILLALGAVVLLIAVIVAVKKNKVERNSNFEQLVDFQTE